MNAKQTFKRTRFAPTPSGYLHVGNVLSFAITTIAAKKTGAKIFLRIDDIDRERTDKKYVQDIFDTLEFMELSWDEGPRNMNEYEREYSQVYRTSMYNDCIEQLCEQGAVFACGCSRSQIPGGVYRGTCQDKRLPLDSKETCLRMNTVLDQEMIMRTLYDGDVKAYLPESVHYFVARRKDGFPAYQLTSVLDDLLYDVDLVIRGEDLWDSTLAQIYLSSVLQLNSFLNTTFHHHRLLGESDGPKLSKSAGATSIQQLRKEHKKPEDIYAIIGSMIDPDVKMRNLNDLELLMDAKII